VSDIKVVHICLCGPVTDNWSYQDNLLPKYQKKLGMEVSVITSKWIYNNKGMLDIDERKEYYNENGIKTVRLGCFLKGTVNSKLKIYSKLYKKIKEEKPDVLFVHDVQFLDVLTIRRYIKKNPTVKLYIDNHADFSNSATNWLSKNILHRFLWKSIAHIIEPYTEKFYGVLPVRVDFLTKFYGLPEEKTELLVMGADDEKVEEALACDFGKIIREKYNIGKDDFLIMTGGKIDLWKQQTLLLMQAVKNINDPKLKLIVFGSIVPELKEKVEVLCDGEVIQYAGWVEGDDSYKYFSAADLVSFPGRHSVFWEQVAGMGIPMLCKYITGTQHVDVGGNVKFLYEDTAEEIETQIRNIVYGGEYQKMKESAMKQGKEIFSYENIAKRSIS